MMACKACSANIATAVDASHDASGDITDQDGMPFRITCFSISSTSNLRPSLPAACSESCLRQVQLVTSCTKLKLAGRPT